MGIRHHLTAAIAIGNVRRFDAERHLVVGQGLEPPVVQVAGRLHRPQAECDEVVAVVRGLDHVQPGGELADVVAQVLDGHPVAGSDAERARVVADLTLDKAILEEAANPNW